MAPEFLICCSISKRFYFQWKAFDLLYKMRYILLVVALLGACDVTNNGRLEMVTFLLDTKNNT